MPGWGGQSVFDELTVFTRVVSLLLHFHAIRPATSFAALALHRSSHGRCKGRCTIGKPLALSRVVVLPSNDRHCQRRADALSLIFGPIQRRASGWKAFCKQVGARSAGIDTNTMGARTCVEFPL